MKRELVVKRPSGWLMLAVVIFVLPAILAALIFATVKSANGGGGPSVALIIIDSLVYAGWMFMMFGFFKLEPNVAGVLLLFGKYVGTVRENGFFWANPLFTKKKISLRAHNMNGEKLKVNDKMGNPIEIAAVVVWRVRDTFEAVFEVEDYTEYVQVQSESAVRHMASRFAYDTMDGTELSLRGSIDEVSVELQKELEERLKSAGVQVIEARLSHLAYAPEIAEAMLRRQQAEAIVSARQTLVNGAVGMVEMALKQLEEHGTVDLDPERKATMTSNLLVVLCGDHSAQPVVNAGSLY